MYLVQTCEIDVFTRNMKGDTALSICETKKWKKAINYLSKMGIAMDKSKNVADEFMDELEKEELKKQAVKDKKRRAVLRKAAEKRGITVEELEKMNEETALKEKADVIAREKAIAEADILEAQRRRQAVADAKEQARLEEEEEMEAERESYREM